MSCHKKNIVMLRGMYFCPWVLEISQFCFWKMIGRDLSIILTIQFFDQSFRLWEIENTILLYLVTFYVCDVITPDLQFWGQFCNHFKNGTIIFYNLERSGIFEPPKLTNLWTKTLLENGSLVQTAIVRLRGIIFLLTPILKIG